MEYTGERYIPELLSAKISYEHWHRYIFASQFCVQKKVADIACGEGYGTAFLSNYAECISGVDVAEDVIRHAKSKYENENTKFITSNATDVCFDSNSLDVVVSYETLEHLTSSDQLLFLEETVRLLNPQGLLVISTPNKKVYSDDASYSNPYHLSEFYKEDFEKFLSKFYPKVVIFNQEIFSGSLINRPSEYLYNVTNIHLGLNAFVPGSTNENRDSEYLIAICCKTDFPFIPGSIMIDEDNKLIKEYNHS